MKPTPDTALQTGAPSDATNADMVGKHAYAVNETAPPLPSVTKGRFPKGVSGNPAGRPKVEPRVRRYARRYDRRMCQVLASIAEDPKQPVGERRRAAMDLIAVGSGRPATTQELVGKGGAPVGPLVAISMGAPPGSALDAARAYRLMTDGVLPPDPGHFRPAIDGEAEPVASDSVTSVPPSAIGDGL